MTPNQIVIAARNSAYLYPTGRGARSCCEDPQEGALPRAIRSEQCDGFASRHREVDPAQRPSVPVSLGETDHLDRGYCRCAAQGVRKLRAPRGAGKRSKRHRMGA
jgi:hypothetical protein